MRAPRVVCVSVLCCVCLDAHTHVHVLSRSLTPLRTNKHKNKSNSDVCNITILTYVDVCMLKYADINFNSSHPSGSVSCISTVESWTGVWCHDIFIPYRVSQRVIWLSFTLPHGVCFTMTLISLLWSSLAPAGPYIPHSRGEVKIQDAAHQRMLTYADVCWRMLTEVKLQEAAHHLQTAHLA